MLPAAANMALPVGRSVAGTASCGAFSATAVNTASAANTATRPTGEAKIKLRVAGHRETSHISQFYQSMGVMAGVGAAAGFTGTDAVSKRACRYRSSVEAVGLGINGFGRIGRQVARIAMQDPEVELKLINASYDSDYLAYMMKYAP